MDQLADDQDTVKRSPTFWTTRKTFLCSMICVVLVLSLAAVLTAVFVHKDQLCVNSTSHDFNMQKICRDSSSSFIFCNITMVESIPENLTYSKGSPSHPSVFEGWLNLLDAAQTSIHIASSYWTLRSDDVPAQDPSSWQGQQIFDRLVEAGKRGIDIKIVHQVSTEYQPNKDTIILEEMGLAQVRSLDLRTLLGSGILHSKMWLVDNKHFFVGSANLDWRSLTQVKELGLVTSNCTCLATDMAKIFDVYWMLAVPNAKIPNPWPHNLVTDINKTDPLSVVINGDKADVYLSSSPPPLCPGGRTTDIDSILDVIQKAQKFIHISVMDYSPTFLYMKPQKYWAVIDDALREAAFNRGVQVYLMASIWSHTHLEMIPFSKSLSVLNDISHVSMEVRLFRVPSYTEAQKRIPYARVQHTKYMVTDNAAYVGTSNWSADYFVSTGGIGYIINQTMSSNENSSSKTIQEQLEAVFQRDWNSNYTKSIWDF